MVPVGDFTIKYDNNSDLQLAFSLRSDTKIMWPGDGPPKDSPECGFENELCTPETTDGESGKALGVSLSDLESLENLKIPSYVAAVEIGL